MNLSKVVNTRWRTHFFLGPWRRQKADYNNGDRGDTYHQRSKIRVVDVQQNSGSCFRFPAVGSGVRQIYTHPDDATGVTDSYPPECTLNDTEWDMHVLGYMQYDISAPIDIPFYIIGDGNLQLGLHTVTESRLITHIIFLVLMNIDYFQPTN